MKQSFVVALIVALTGCAAATQPILVVRSDFLQSSASAGQTNEILTAVERGLTHDLELSESARRGGLRRAELTDVRVYGAMAEVSGCGTFYDAVPERYAIVLVARKPETAWTLESWKIATAGPNGPRQPCR